jgi:ABC-type phosphate transport system ATPase subunit
MVFFSSQIRIISNNYVILYMSNFFQQNQRQYTITLFFRSPPIIQRISTTKNPFNMPQMQKTQGVISGEGIRHSPLFSTLSRKLLLNKA